MNPSPYRIQQRAFTKPTEFRCMAPHAHQAVLQIRSIHGGPATLHPMHKAIDGCWHGKLELGRGRYLYRFLVDNHPVLDPTAHGTVADDHGGSYSMREVGH